MGHAIHGFIGGYDALVAAARGVRGARVFALGLGFGFMPVVPGMPGAHDDDPVSGLECFHRLPAAMEAWAVGASGEMTVAYVETDYFGGTGTQRAIVWRGGGVVFGPARTGDEYGRVQTPLLDGAINRAMREMGVRRGGALDEFAALGLDRHRRNEDWVARES